MLPTHSLPFRYVMLALTVQKQWGCPNVRQSGHAKQGRRVSCFLINLFILGGAGSLVMRVAFSSCGNWELLSSCSAWVSRGGGFSLKHMGL